MGAGKKISLDLNGLRFFGHYGLYPVESKWTTELRVDVSLQLDLSPAQPIQLTDTLDYTAVYRVIAAEMNQNHQLLEGIAVNLVRVLKQMDQRISSCRVKIEKQAQLGGPSGGVCILLEE